MTDTYIPLPHKYRPRTWADLVGQEVAVATLRRAIQRDRVFPTYIFAGAAGCGKTTAARVLGMALNCENLSDDADPCLRCPSCTAALLQRNPDIVEIDGPSHGTVAHIRDLKERALWSPQNRRRVFIIDEAHGLSRDAFEAFLKLLEEPPSHVVFVLATTNPEKIPATIHSRSIPLDFRRHTEDAVIGRLVHICTLEDIAVSKAGLELIAKSVDGNLRDAITELDKITTIHPDEMITPDLVAYTLGIISGSEIHDIMLAVGKQDAQALEQALMPTLGRTTEFGLIVRAFIDWYRDVLRVKLGASMFLERTESDTALIMAFAKSMDTAQIKFAMQTCWQMADKTRFGSHSPKTFFLTGLYQLMAIVDSPPEIEESAPQPTGKVFAAPATEPAEATFSAATTDDLEAELMRLAER